MKKNSLRDEGSKIAHSELDKGKIDKGLFGILSAILMLLVLVVILIIHLSDIVNDKLAATYFSSNIVAIAGLLVSVFSCDKCKDWLSDYMRFSRHGNRIVLAILIILLALVISFALFFCGVGGALANILSFIAVMIGFILI